MEELELLRENFQPVLLGNSALARKLARELYMRFGIVSYICDTKKNFWSSLSFSYIQFKVCSPDCDELLCTELFDISALDETCVFAVIPCTDVFSDFLSRNTEKIEGRYIISEPDKIYESFPLLRRRGVAAK